MKQSLIAYLTELRRRPMTRSQSLDYLINHNAKKSSFYYLLYNGFIEKDRFSYYYVTEKGLRYVRSGEISLPISFGIEFEGNAISPRGIRGWVKNRYHTISSWSYQTDPTALFEHRSPVFLNIKDALSSVHRQYKYWLSETGDIAPFFRPTKYYRSIGHHVHISKGPNYKLRASEAGEIIDKLVRFLPFLYFINANGRKTKYLSWRLVDHPYTPPKRTKGLSTSGREEFWLSSEHGTIEFRRFDANVPPVDLAVVFLMKKIIQKCEMRDWDPLQFQTEVRKINEYPYNIKTILEIRKRFSEISEVKISDLPNSVKQVLVLSFVYLKNPSEFIGVYNYEFSKRTATEDVFLEAKELHGEKRKLKQQLLQSLNDYNTIGDLLNKIIADKKTEYLIKKQNLLISYQKLSPKQNISKYLNSTKRPPFISPKEWENLQEKVEQNFFRIYELTDSEFSDLVRLVQVHFPSYTAEQIKKSSLRYYAYKEDERIVGFVIFDVPAHRLVFDAHVPHDKLLQMCKKLRIRGCE